MYLCHLQLVKQKPSSQQKGGTLWLVGSQEISAVWNSKNTVSTVCKHNNNCIFYNKNCHHHLCHSLHSWSSTDWWQLTIATFWYVPRPNSFRVLPMKSGAWVWVNWKRKTKFILNNFGCQCTTGRGFYFLEYNNPEHQQQH